MSNDLTELREGNAPSVLYFNSREYMGVGACNYRRHVIGVVLQGRKAVFEGDRQVAIEMGDIFCMEPGTYYIEDMPQDNGSFQQVLLFFTREELHSIIKSLRDQQIGTDVDTSPEPSDARNFVTEKSWSSLSTIFRQIVSMVRMRATNFDDSADRDKAREALYTIIFNEESVIRRRLLLSIREERDEVRSVVVQRLLQGVAIETIAKELGRGVRSLKQEFVDCYGMTPHKWVVEQRLLKAAVMLITTTQSVQEISTCCRFSNPSHFIASFKERYNLTPAQYRKVGGTAKEEEPAE